MKFRTKLVTTTTDPDEDDLLAAELSQIDARVKVRMRGLPMSLQLNTKLLRKASNERFIQHSETLRKSLSTSDLSSIPTVEDLVAEVEPRLHLVAVAEEFAR
jgi:hypothetical protein